MNSPLIVIFAAIALDAAGIGLVFPILPRLIEDVTRTADVAPYVGILAALYAAMQFAFAPVLGALSDRWGRRPVLLISLGGSAMNYVLMAFAPYPPGREKLDLAALNPLRPLRWAVSMKTLMPVIGTFFILSAAGEVYRTCWALWGQDVCRWNGRWIALSLGAFGVCQTLALAFLPGPAVQRLGERGAVLTGITGTCVALVVMAFARQGWVVFAIMPVVALAGLGTPALQSFATRLVDESRQGQFQGVLASVMSLASIAGPLVFSSVYFMVRAQWPGAIWLSALAVNAMAVPLVLSLWFSAAATPVYKLG